jgi:hypothetical protein
VLRDRPDTIVQLYASIEAFARSLGTVEFVTRNRYVLLRSVRIFADLVIMTDAVRIAMHLQREVHDPHFFRVVTDGKKFSHVAKLKTQRDFNALKRHLKEAYEVSLG